VVSARSERPLGLELDTNAGLRIRDYLDKRPPTGPEIAVEAGVSRQYVWRVLNGRERPSGKILAALERLGVPVIEILSDARNAA
jgi:transcriptional regulator with XRE-family HTH domain